MSKPYGYKLAGSVWVDSGTLMISDPCYVDEGFDYSKWGDEIDWDNGRDILPPPTKFRNDANPHEGSFAFSTRWGDGSYPVYVKRDKDGRVTAVLVDTDPEEEL